MDWALVNNVGVASDGLHYFPEASEETMWNMINVNMASVTIMMKMVLPKMEARHSAVMSNQTKVWKTKTGPLQGDKAWSRDPRSALFEILHNKENF